MPITLQQGFPDRLGPRFIQVDKWGEVEAEAEAVEGVVVAAEAQPEGEAGAHPRVTRRPPYLPRRTRSPVGIAIPLAMWRGFPEPAL